MQPIEKSQNNMTDEMNIQELGEGWVGGEALAIAIYCTLKYSDDFSKAVLASINHSGDSDSVGCITGAIIGTALGYEGIPNQWVKKIENRSILNTVSNELYRLRRIEKL